jgi:thiosulfate dehydrogenase [quinone] large subunit
VNTTAATAIPGVWNLGFLRAHPVKLVGIVLHLFFRCLFGLFWIAAGTNKIRKDWVTTDMLPDSFPVFYLQKFAIPLYKLVAVVVTTGELYVGVALLLGFTTRWAAGVSFFILVNLALGGYYDASLIPFFLLSILMMSWNSGHWFGLDRRLHARNPASIWFR